jgi:hypothetical protein
MHSTLWLTAQPHRLQHAQQRILAKVLRHKMTALVQARKDKGEFSGNRLSTESASRPPGFRTRAISRKLWSGSAKCSKQLRLTTLSKVLLGKGSHSDTPHT